MSSAEFEALVTSYLEGSASPEQVEALRVVLKDSPVLRSRFQTRRRLHQAQLAFLSRHEERSMSSVMAWLSSYGQRVGRSFAYLCLLALVFVELRVTIPAEYSGLLSYVDAPAEEQAAVIPDMPLRLVTDIAQDFDLSQSVEVPDLTMPNLVMPDMGMPAEEPVSVEV